MPMTDSKATELAYAGIPYPVVMEMMAATTTPERLAALGVSGTTALELAKQINNNTVDRATLGAVGVPGHRVAAIVRGRT